MPSWQAGCRKGAQTQRCPWATARHEGGPGCRILWGKRKCPSVLLGLAGFIIKSTWEINQRNTVSCSIVWEPHLREGVRDPATHVRGSETGREGEADVASGPGVSLEAPGGGTSFPGAAGPQMDIFPTGRRRLFLVMTLIVSEAPNLNSSRERKEFLVSP